MAGFPAESSSTDSAFILQADYHHHSHHITSAIQSASSFHSDISLCSHDGSVISTSSFLLSLSSPFLANLLSTVPVPSCFPTCIILPDCSTSSLNDLISLLATGLGVTKCVGSVYRQAGQVIDAAKLLGVKFGSFSHEAVSFTRRKIIYQAHSIENILNSKERIEPIDRDLVGDINFVNKTPNSIGVSQSQRSNKEQLQTFGQYNVENIYPGVEQTFQNEINNSDQLPSVSNAKSVDLDETPCIDTFEIEQKSEEKSNEASFNTSSLENNSKLMKCHSSKIGAPKETIYTCDNCEKILENEKALNFHKLIHNSNEDKIKSANFANCINEEEKSEGKLKKSRKFACKECGKMLSNKFRLNYHMKIHLNTKTLDNTVNNTPIACETFGKNMSSKANLKRHMVTRYQKGVSSATNLDIKDGKNKVTDQEVIKNSGTNFEMNNNSILNKFETNNETVCPNKKEITIKSKKSGVLMVNQLSLPSGMIPSPIILPKTYSKRDMKLALEALKLKKMSLSKVSEVYGIPPTSLWKRANRLGIPTSKETKTWTQEDLTNALAALQNREMSANKAAKLYKIPSLYKIAKQKGIELGKNTTVQWSAEDMSSALDAVSTGAMSINQAAIHYHIPYTTLFGRINRLKRENGIELVQPFNSTATTWCQEDLNSALEAIKGGMAVQKVATKFGIPVTTLYGKCKKAGIELGKNNAVHWSDEDMTSALDLVSMGALSITQAAINHNIPYSSLYGRINRLKREKLADHEMEDLTVDTKETLEVDYKKQKDTINEDDHEKEQNWEEVVIDGLPLFCINDVRTLKEVSLPKEPSTSLNSSSC